eukprot:scaffold145130_cov31-Tisochrysis_lutea.AAC.2
MIVSIKGSKQPRRQESFGGGDGFVTRQGLRARSASTRVQAYGTSRSGGALIQRGAAGANGRAWCAK